MNTDLERIRHALHSDASLPSTQTPPTAVEIWSRVEFRLRYRARSKSSDYFDSAAALGASIFFMTFILSTDGFATSLFAIGAVLAAASLVAFVLSLKRLD